MNTLYVFEKHDQLFEVWRQQEMDGLKVAHLDFHCDMRGLLADRVQQRAYRIRDGSPELDEGNFITHAIFAGRVKRVRWIHHIPGGRRDDVGGVKLESDLSARLARWRLRRKEDPGVPFVYQDMTFDAWAGLDEGEFLDIDWDFFACKDYPLASIGARVEAFFHRPFTYKPRHTALCYSPDYSHDTRPAFKAFYLRLAEALEADIRILPSPQPKRESPEWRWGLPPLVYHKLRRDYRKANRWLRYKNIY